MGTWRRRDGDTDWTAPGLIDRLRFLWDKGLPTSAIGLEFGITKNAVVAKASRLGLTPRPSPIIKTGPTGKSHAKRVIEAPSGPIMVVRHRAPIPQLSVVPVRVPRCLFPAWPTTKTYEMVLNPRFCDAPTSSGSYCAEHARICYVRRSVPQHAHQE